jgi:hypothetical protein
MADQSDVESVLVNLVPLHSDFDSLSPGGPCGSDGPPCFAIRR